MLIRFLSGYTGCEQYCQHLEVHFFSICRVKMCRLGGPLWIYRFIDISTHTHTPYTLWSWRWRVYMYIYVWILYHPFPLAFNLCEILYFTKNENSEESTNFISCISLVLYQRETSLQQPSSLCSVLGILHFNVQKRKKKHMYRYWFCRLCRFIRINRILSFRVVGE